MKVILCMVESLDGKTTKWGKNNIHSWTSKEDQDHFAKAKEQSECIIMGRKTYELGKTYMKHIPGRLRVVMTSNPNQYNNEVIPQQLEFTNENPVDLIKRLEQQGYNQVLLAGGAGTNSLFLKACLVNELWLTIEPKLFGSGNSLIGEEIFDVNLKLLNIEKLNEQGTLLLKYSIQN